MINKKYKTIIITGASQGLGSEIAKEACNKNYMYYSLSRFSDVDVGNYSHVQTYFNDMALSLKGYEEDCPLALVNNAGICFTGNVLEMSEYQWLEQVNTNLTGVFYCSKEYIKLCKEYNFKGKIINIASTAGTGARPGRACYAATKAAVINFSLSLAEEMKNYGIKVYCICPGAFDSQLRRNIAPDDNFKDMLKPNEIAKFIIDIIDNGNFLDNQIIYTRK
jgi:3-oxoacyl-[acyl-carrier protein] reductase